MMFARLKYEPSNVSTLKLSVPEKISPRVLEESYDIVTVYEQDYYMQLLNKQLLKRILLNIPI